MKTSKIWQIVSLSAAAMLTPLLVAAQQTPPTPEKSDAPPPGKKLEKLEESDPPSIKVGKPKNENKITETRDDSGVKQVKVENGLGTYYVKPNQQVGDSLPGDVQSSQNHGVQWKVLEFDLGSKGKKSEKSDDAAQPAPKDGTVTDEPKK
jgi:hypothetical protein